MKTAIIIVGYDGISSMYCGVGTVVRNMVISLNKLNKNSFDLFLINSAVNKNSLGFSKKLMDESDEICKKNHGRLIDLKSFKYRFNQYGDPSVWKKNSIEVYKIIKDLSKNYSKCIIILHDVPFLGVSSIAHKKNLKKCIFISIPHATGYFHGKDKKSKLSRIRWEKENLYEHKNFYVGYISKYMKKHLETKYKIKKNLVNMTNGLIITKKRLPKQKYSLLPENILKNKKLILSYGRSEPYKNLQAVINATKKLNKDYYTIIIASDNTSDNPLYNYFKKFSSNSCKIIPHHIDRNIIRDFIEKFPVLVIVPSLKEPFGLIPCEARYWGKKFGSVVLVSKYGGLKEQVEDNKDGFIIKSLDPDQLAKQIKEICKLKINQRKKISLRGFEKVKRDYDYEKRMKKLINRFV